MSTIRKKVKVEQMLQVNQSTKKSRLIKHSASVKNERCHGNDAGAKIAIKRQDVIAATRVAEQT